ncbi:hypothetical protein B0H16DRAFT_1695830 [Mycena metata]|uniref:Uncharacterized protein n=1 Tax=Mycena metata TaxID=1033252 RepID=A0AAD7I5I1_9AGAR|nr:hypothetical protein B0H16DRAFT_1695830 [Mycena metata]
MSSSPPAPAPYYGNPSSIEPSSLDDFASVFHSNGSGGPLYYSPYFLYEYRRAIALCSAEVLRTSGNYAYNQLLSDYQRLAEDHETLQNVFAGMARQLDTLMMFASGEFLHVRDRNPSFPGPAWSGHAYDNPPLLSRDVSQEFLAAARAEYSFSLPMIPTRPPTPQPASTRNVPGLQPAAVRNISGPQATTVRNGNGPGGRQRPVVPGPAQRLAQHGSGGTVSNAATGATVSNAATGVTGPVAGISGVSGVLPPGVGGARPVQAPGWDNLSAMRARM